MREFRIVSKEEQELESGVAFEFNTPKELFDAVYELSHFQYSLMRGESLPTILDRSVCRVVDKKDLYKEEF